MTEIFFIMHDPIPRNLKIWMFTIVYHNVKVIYDLYILMSQAFCFFIHMIMSWYSPFQCLPTLSLFVCVEVLRPSQPSGVMSSAVSLPNHTFTGQASSKRLTSILCTFFRQKVTTAGFVSPAMPCTRVHTHTCAYTRTHTHACSCIWVHVRSHISVCADTRRVCGNTHSYVCTQTHRHMQFVSCLNKGCYFNFVQTEQFGLGTV